MEPSTQDFLETECFALPQQVKNDLASRMKTAKNIKSVELELNGETIENAKEFADMLIALKKRGVRLTHKISLKLDFPRVISKDHALDLLESIPKVKNGCVRARIHFDKAEINSHEN